MRIELDIDADLLAAIENAAESEGISVSALVSRLLRSAVVKEETPSEEPGSLLGFRPFASRGGSVTNETVERLRNETGV